MKNIFSSLIILLICSIGLNAQSSELYIKESKDGNQLRWIPSDLDIWVKGMTDGYIIERKNPNGAFVQLHSEPIKPVVLSGGKAINWPDSMLQFLWKEPDSVYHYLSNSKKRIELEKYYNFYNDRLITTKGGIERSGLYFEDLTAESGIQYVYKVRLVNDDYQQLSDSKLKYPPTIKPSIEVNDTDIKVVWNRKSFSSTSNFCSIISSSDKSMKAYNREILSPLLNEEKNHLEYVFTDSLETMESIRYYQFNNLDIFGNELKSEIIKIEAKDITPPLKADINEIVSEQENIALISWKKKVKEADFIGYNVFRSIYADSLFEKINQSILPPETMEYKDAYNGTKTWIYYYIETIDKAGNTSRTIAKLAILKGNGAPDTPTGLNAIINDKGIVNISWDKNSEKDLIGYRLSASRKLNHKFIPIDNDYLKENKYTDTLALNFFNKEYFYKISAIDSNFNRSEYSEPVKIILPDTIKPVQPILHRPKVEGKNISLSWRLGTDIDIIKTEILYKTDDADQWSTIATLKDYKTNNYDYNIDTGNYLFAIQVVDDSGNKSILSNIRYVEIKEPRIKPAVTNLKFEFNKDKSVHFTWNMKGIKSDISYYLFRRESTQSKPKLIQKVSTQSAIDSNVTKGINYIYYVTPVDNRGRTYEVSDMVEVKFN